MRASNGAGTDPLVGDLMRRRFIALSPSETLLDAELVMRFARVRFLPVVEDGEIRGFLSIRALLAALLAREPAERDAERAAFLRETLVRAVMDPQPEPITPDASLREAAERLSALEVGCLPVVEPSAGRLVGILTEADLLRAAYEPRPAARLR
jgi:CBS domain-containing protein